MPAYPSLPTKTHDYSLHPAVGYILKTARKKNTVTTTRCGGIIRKKEGVLKIYVYCQGIYTRVRKTCSLAYGGDAL